MTTTITATPVNSVEELDAEEQAADKLILPIEVDVRNKRKDVAISLLAQILAKGLARTIDEMRLMMGRVNPEYNQLSDRTILRYKKIITERNRKRLEDGGLFARTTEQVALDMSDKFELINAEFWRMYHDKDTSRQVKAIALKEIRETMQSHLKIMQSLGMVNEAPTKVQQLGADGKPVDPMGITIEKGVILQGFNEFMNMQYRDPLPSHKAETTISPKNEEPQQGLKPLE